MRRIAHFGLAALLVVSLWRPVGAQILDTSEDHDETLRPFAVGFAKTRIFERWTGYAIYLGQGVAITAAHVVGRFPFLTHPRLLVGEQELPAAVVKKGSLDETDLALLSVDVTRLPMRLALRRMHVCKGAANIGESVMVVDLNGTARSRILSPSIVPVRYRGKFGTVVAKPPFVGQSGSGVFHPQTKCLLGIITRAIRRVQFEQTTVGTTNKLVDVARYFVPASAISEFMPAELRF